MTNADDSMKTLCHLSSPLFGERVIRCSEGIEITSTPDGFIVNDRPAGAFRLCFNRDGLQTDRDGNVLSDPHYWMEP